VIPGQLRLRVGDDFSKLPTDPREARLQMLAAETLDNQGDGIRSFVGVVLALIAVKRPVFLVDEPETFLHPLQAFRIGHFLAHQASESRQIVIATHSVDVLRGVLSHRKDITLIRIDRVGNANTFSLLDPARVDRLANDPLLSSSRVLDGLFYAGAVVVEGDRDARFYHMVSHKLPVKEELHFVNANDKRTIPRIMRVYREMGVRCAAIVDFDVLNNVTELRDHLVAIDLPAQEQDYVLATQKLIAHDAKAAGPDERLSAVLNQLSAIESKVRSIRDEATGTWTGDLEERESVLRWLESRFRELVETTRPWKQYKELGRAALRPELAERFDELWRLCAARGLFVIETGQLESMLIEQDVPRSSDKRAWIEKALLLIPHLQVDEGRHPWKCMTRVHAFLAIHDAHPIPDIARVPSPEVAPLDHAKQNPAEHAHDATEMSRERGSSGLLRWIRRRRG
jgi:AAA domain, putative AbiEii toxin, Type IV TA system